jgi:hypothetical protein
MDGEALMPWTLTIPEEMYERLHAHLFPGDRDEHGAVILAGMQRRSDGSLRLLARELALAEDGKDYVPGRYGYRMLRAEFLQPFALQARDELLAYIAIHNHGGRGHVGFSGDDLRHRSAATPRSTRSPGCPSVHWCSAKTRSPGTSTSTAGGRKHFEASLSSVETGSSWYRRLTASWVILMRRAPGRHYSSAMPV